MWLEELTNKLPMLPGRKYRTVCYFIRSGHEIPAGSVITLIGRPNPNYRELQFVTTDDKTFLLHDCDALDNLVKDYLTW